jgi:hypothetical protein
MKGLISLMVIRASVTSEVLGLTPNRSEYSSNLMTLIGVGTVCSKKVKKSDT